MTSRIQTRTQQTVLKDYELHHSAVSAPIISIASNTANTHSPSSMSPRAWDTTHRRVPPYRPTNRTRDQSEIRVYKNGVEQAFIGVMFSGVFINAVSQ